MTDAEHPAALRAMIAARDAEIERLRDEIGGLRALLADDIAAWKKIAAERWADSAPTTITVTWPSDDET